MISKKSGDHIGVYVCIGVNAKTTFEGLYANGSFIHVLMNEAWPSLEMTLNVLKHTFD